MSGPTSTKNQAFSLMGDMGLGDQLKTQVDDDLEERRKKMMNMKTGSGPFDPMRPLSLSMMGGGLGL